MATFFEGFEFMSNFSVVFTFLFVYALVYGILLTTNPFKDEGKKNLYAIIAFTASILVLFSGTVTNVVSFMAPWFILAILVVFLCF